MQKKALVLFSAGKDSSMALDLAIKQGYLCRALIAINLDGQLQLTDGPEIKAPVAKLVAEKIFGVQAKVFSTDNINYKKDFLHEVEKQIISFGANVVLTGDINHPDGHINLLRKGIGKKRQTVSFVSIGDLYTKNGIFNSEIYMNDVLRNLTLVFSGIRMPDFKDPNILGRSFTMEAVEQMNSLGIDSLGEDGEYQSLCIGRNSSPDILSIDNFTTRIFSGRDAKCYQYNVMNIEHCKLLDKTSIHNNSKTSIHNNSKTSIPYHFEKPE